MRKTTLIFSGLLFMAAFLNAQDEMIVGWTFPSSSPVADTGVSVNLDKEIITTGETSEIEFKNGFESKAAQLTGWQDGMDSKGWVININAEGYDDLTVSSRQQSGGNDPGPENFRLQYSVDMGNTWINIEGGEINVENDWETSFVDNLALPEECANQPDLMICWRMSSNEASGSGGEVLETGKSKIDEIYIKGNKISGIADNEISGLRFYPNPVKDRINYRAEEKISKIGLYDLNGNQVLENPVNSNSGTVILSELKSGLYFIRFTGTDAKIKTKTLIVQ